VFGKRMGLAERDMARRAGPLPVPSHNELLDPRDDRVGQEKHSPETGRVRVEDGQQKADPYGSALTPLQQILNIKSGDVDQLPSCCDNVNQGFHLGDSSSLGSRDSLPVSRRLEIELSPREGGSIEVKGSAVNSKG
jgi:hypothetical protein